MFNSQRKLLSQNFLKSRELVASFLRSSSIGEKDTVLEIGPGKGIITEELLKTAAKVITVELDASFCNELRAKFGMYKNFYLYNSDFLSFRLPDQPYKVFSNIPFRYTGEIIQKLLRSSNPPLDSCLIVQREAAEKFLSGSLVSILYQPYFIFSIQHEFQKTDFAPVPNIDIVLLQIHKREQPLVDGKHKTIFEDFVTYTFNRKKPYVTSLPSNPTSVTFSQWVALFNNFLGQNSPIKMRRVTGSATKLLREQQKLQKIHRTRKDKNWKEHGAINS